MYSKETITEQLELIRTQYTELHESLRSLQNNYGNTELFLANTELMCSFDNFVKVNYKILREADLL